MGWLCHPNSRIVSKKWLFESICFWPIPNWRPHPTASDPFPSANAPELPGALPAMAHESSKPAPPSPKASQRSSSTERGVFSGDRSIFLCSLMFLFYLFLLRLRVGWLRSWGVFELRFSCLQGLCSQKINVNLKVKLTNKKRMTTRLVLSITDTSPWCKQSWALRNGDQIWGRKKNILYMCGEPSCVATKIHQANTHFVKPVGPTAPCLKQWQWRNKRLHQSGGGRPYSPKVFQSRI